MRHSTAAHIANLAALPVADTIASVASDAEALRTRITRLSASIGGPAGRHLTDAEGYADELTMTLQHAGDLA